MVIAQNQAFRHGKRTKNKLGLPFYAPLPYSYRTEDEEPRVEQRTQGTVDGNEGAWRDFSALFSRAKARALIVVDDCPLSKTALLAWRHDRQNRTARNSKPFHI